MPITIAFFNNKGGVGKTTLACNYASYLNEQHRQRVVVVDADPQANATQLLLQEDVWEGIYDRARSEQRTIMQAFRGIRAGDSAVDRTPELHDAPRFGVKVVAGHPSLSVMEDHLSSSWGEFFLRRPGGLRRTLWLRQLVERLPADVVIVDLGPSLGALNRSVLLSCDFFVTPVAADLFSLYALENIGERLGVWLGEYRRAYDEMTAVEEVEEWDLPATLPVSTGWAGYSVQQYLAKSAHGVVRGVDSYERYRKRIPEKAKRLHRFGNLSAHQADLGIVPNMFSMVPLAQAAHAPIANLAPSDGVRGAQVTQRARYSEQLGDMFRNLSSNVGLVDPDE